MHQASVLNFETAVSSLRPLSNAIRFEVYHSIQIDTRYVLLWWAVLFNSDIFLCKEIHISVTEIYFLP
jgi:hypothetical protein